MKKNTAGQKIGAQIITAADGTAFSGSVTVYVTKDAGAQAIGSVGSGAATSEGNGYYTYAPSQAETDGDLLAYTFIGSGAIPVTVQVVPSSEVLDVVFANHNTAGTLGYIIGGVLIAANFNQRTVAVTGSNHVAADIHELQAGVIQSTHFAAGAIDANALAASAVAEIQSGLATAANQVVLIDGVGYITAVLMGSISDAGTAAETYQIAFGGATYTVDFAGLDATGNRSTTTRVKT